MADKKLNIKVRTKGAKKSKKDLKGVEGGMKSLGKSALIAGAAFFGARGLITGFKKIIDLSAQQELAEKKLEASLGRVSQSLLDQARALQQVSMFGDEAIIEAQALIAAFVDDEEAIKKATQATLDLAAAKGMDLTAAADLVSKTLGSSTNAMSRYGIEVTGAVGSTERLNTLTGNIADKFGGQAKAQTDTLAGSMVQLEMAVGDLGERLGDEFSEDVRTAADSMTFFVESINIGEIKKGLSWWGKFLDRLNPGLAQLIDKTNEMQEARQKLLTDVPIDSPFPTDEEMEKLKSSFYITGKVWDIRREESGLLREVYVPKLIEASEAEKKAAQFASQTAISLGTSALMGDNVTESLKRAVIQLMIMVAQAKLYDYFMTSASGGTNKVSSAIVNFLFGKSPTQTSPSPNGGGSNSFLFGASPTQAAPSASAASGSKIVINNNISGFGTIDSNFASNSLIPAINKAISTGQARIG